MAQYVDGYVIPLPKKNMNKYKKMATLGRDVWMDCGAIDYYETLGHDLKTQWGTSFIKLCKLKPSETVIFAWIVYKSKTHRDAVNKRVQKHPKMQIEFPNLFEMKRLTVGGFKVAVKAKTKKKR